MLQNDLRQIRTYQIAAAMKLERLPLRQSSFSSVSHFDMLPLRAIFLDQLVDVRPLRSHWVHSTRSTSSLPSRNTIETRRKLDFSL